MTRLRATILAALAGALVVAPTAQAKPVRCDSGAAELATGALRVFSIHYRDRGSFGLTGFHQYACLDASARPLRLGDSAWGSITGDSDGGTPVLVFGGGRYLAVGSFESGEGGLENAGYDVIDLRARRTVTTIETGEVPDELPPLRLSATGDAIFTDDQQAIELFAPGAKKGVALSTAGVSASGAAISGTTVYWSENGEARTYTLAGRAPADATDTIEAPVIPFEPTACDRRPGTTVAHSGLARVVRRRGTLLACLDSARAVALPAATRPADVRIARGRWVYTGTSVIDLKARRTVLKLAAPRSATLLADGTLAWIEQGGRLLVGSPGDAAPAELAPAGDALASSGTVVYWTAGGVPHRFDTG